MVALDVLPIMTLNYPADVCLSTSVFFGQVFLLLSIAKSFSNLVYILLTQPSIIMSLTLCSIYLIIRVPSFSDHVCSIIHSISQKQMIRPDTRRIITFMEDTNTFFKRAIMYHPRYSMSELWTSISSANTHLSVARLISAGDPYPTIRSLFNFFPKSFSNKFYRMSFFPASHIDVYTKNTLVMKEVAA